MSLVTTTTFPDDDGQRGMGEVAGFKKLKKRLKKVTKPIGRIVKPMLSMAQGGGGLLTAMGPWGMAAGAALAAGGALAARHKNKKLKKKQRRAQQQAAMAEQAQYPQQAPQVHHDAMPSAESFATYPASLPMSDQHETVPVFMPSTEPPAEWQQPMPAPDTIDQPAMPFADAPPPEQPPAAVMVLPSDDIPEVQAVLDPEPVTMAGLGSPPATVGGIDWRILSAFAGFTLGTWWLLRDRRPSPRSRRR
jgi:type II secretory pathway pseudopilin PulG